MIRLRRTTLWHSDAGSGRRPPHQERSCARETSDFVFGYTFAICLGKSGYRKGRGQAAEVIDRAGHFQGRHRSDRWQRPLMPFDRSSIQGHNRSSPMDDQAKGRQARRMSSFQLEAHPAEHRPASACVESVPRHLRYRPEDRGRPSLDHNQQDCPTPYWRGRLQY